MNPPLPLMGRQKRFTGSGPAVQGRKSNQEAAQMKKTKKKKAKKKKR
jgi:hypothetical protein